MEYEAAVKGALRLKGSASHEIKKKKKKNNKEPVKPEGERKMNEQKGGQDVPKTIQKTKAQLKFEQMKEEQNKKRIMDKARKTHKQHVEEFNRHLDNLTEHYDVPKVSWTK